MIMYCSQIIKPLYVDTIVSDANTIMRQLGYLTLAELSALVGWRPLTEEMTTCKTYQETQFSYSPKTDSKNPRNIK